MELRRGWFEGHVPLRKQGLQEVGKRCGWSDGMRWTDGDGKMKPDQIENNECTVYRRDSRRV